MLGHGSCSSLCNECDSQSGYQKVTALTNEIKINFDQRQSILIQFFVL